jgi:hypothetical protein
MTETDKTLGQLHEPQIYKDYTRAENACKILIMHEREGRWYDVAQHSSRGWVIACYRGRKFIEYV